MDRNQTEDRRVPRYFFSAPAEIILDGATTRARSAELSPHGCYFETNMAISRGTVVKVRIFATDYFEADARIVYYHASELCVVFQRVSRECQQVLTKWLTAARTEEAHGTQT